MEDDVIHFSHIINRFFQNNIKVKMQKTCNYISQMRFDHYFDYILSKTSKTTSHLHINNTDYK